jgi:ubiquinone biosynthesis monooxygenase Coq7
MSLIQKMLRVDHAGELGANYIYKGQLAILGSNPKIQKMYEQEQHHLKVFEQILPNTRTRPSLLRPFWELGGFILGASTALMGKNAAMACTEAVETVIGQHYNDQIRLLLADENLKENEELQKLIKVLCEFRDEELEHLDIAVEDGAKDAIGYSGLNFVIQQGCKVAIKVAEKV